MLEKGTKVKIKEDLEKGGYYKAGLIENMLRYAGKIAIITKYSEMENYFLDIDEEAWAWSDDMFDVIEEGNFEDIAKIVIKEMKHGGIVIPIETLPKNVERFREILLDLADLYKRKNMDYGNSFKKSHEEFGAVAGLVRMSDKFNRAKQLLLGKSEQQVQDEKVRDTLVDLASYAIMLVMELEGEVDGR